MNTNNDYIIYLKLFETLPTKKNSFMTLKPYKYAGEALKIKGDIILHYISYKKCRRVIPLFIKVLPTTTLLVRRVPILMIHLFNACNKPIFFCSLLPLLRRLIVKIFIFVVSCAENRRILCYSFHVYRNQV